MNKKEIEELIKFVSKAGVSEVSLEQEGFKITIKNEQKVREQIVVQAAQPTIAAPQPVAIPQAPQAAAAAPSAPVSTSGDDSKYITIKSPMIGTFYRSPAPDKPNFVNVGDDIKAGKAICIIEAMKLFNEIESEVSGKIVKCLVENASPVEYDQPLFLVDPS
ncbi:MAG: acetyl-CoA carboxylase biotin carboxyl carrier protein [Bacteroidia bacterium]|nr:acetyl-CoA carboxylase biotin carboxyl carrier protein [Bacteroidia bacterium]